MTSITVTCTTTHETKRQEKLVSSNWGTLLESAATAQRSEHKDLPDDVFIVDQIFTNEECSRLIAASEQIGYGCTNYVKAYRGNLRLMTTDQSLADSVATGGRKIILRVEGFLFDYGSLVVDYDDSTLADVYKILESSQKTIFWNH